MTPPRTRRLVGLAVALTLVASCSPGAADDPDQDQPASDTTAPTATDSPAGTVAAEDLADFYDQQLEWSACGDGFECATLTVPLDYDDPAGDTIDVEVNRRPSTGDADRVGSLIVNPGGPGASGLDYARTPDVASDEVLAAFDLVGFDPRGVGASTPVECLDDADFDAYIEIDGSPDDATEVTVLDEASREFAEACQAESGQLLPHVGTADVARDLDMLRAVLGDEELYYLGKSYGTLIGATYAELFPERVGRLVLDGAIDPSLSPAEQGMAQAAGFEGALTAFVEDCLLYTECPLDGRPGAAVAQVADLMAEIDADPLPTDSGRELVQTLATYGLAVTLYDREFGWPLLRQALGAAIDEGDGTVLLMLSDIYLGREPDGSYTSNSNEAIAAVSCIDSDGLADVAAIEALLPDYEERSPIFGSFIAYGGLVCAHWPAEPTDEALEITAAGAAPILVVGTTRDPATPYEWSQALAAQLDSGLLLTYEGDGHTAYGRGSPCVDDAVDAYLLTGEPSAEDTAC